MTKCEAEIEAAVLNLLVNHGRWGHHYFPIDALVHTVANKAQPNGRRVKKAIDRLVKSGHLWLHKKRETVSLNPRLKRQILELLERSGMT